MKIAYISDLHIDFHLSLNASNKAIHKWITTKLQPEPADVLCIAGDTGHYNTQDIAVLKCLKEYYPTILLVGGNHNLYLTSKSQQQQYQYNSFARLEEFYRMCTDIGIIPLDGTTHTIDSVVFGGTMLWYKIQNYNTWASYYSDSRLIMESYPFTLPYSTTKAVTFNSNRYYEEQLTKIPKCDIFLSHVSPIDIPEIAYNDEYDQFYYADCLDKLKEANISVSIFGHYHDKCSFLRDDILFATAAFGYPSEPNNSIQTFTYIKD